MPYQFNLNILEQCHVSPSPNSIIPSSISLPLTFLDIPWLFYPSNQTLFFFPKPSPKTTIITTLKQSLSLTLHHFYPLAGNLALPSPPAEPYIVYTKKDSISVTIAQTNTKIKHFSCNNPRNIKQLYSLLPKLPSPFMPRDSHVGHVVPLLSIQITVFGDSAYSIGVTMQHAAVDERTFDQFMKSWAFICKSLLKKDSLFTLTSTPWLDRSIIRDNKSLKRTFLKQWWNLFNSLNETHDQQKDNHDIVLSTFVLSSLDINMIKNHILVKCKMLNEDDPVHLSPYVSACAYLWKCLIKIQETRDSIKGGPQYLGFNAGGITRLGNEIPSTYFGNCIGFGRCKAHGSELLGENGIIFAAKSIGKEIKRLDKDVLGGANKWICDWDELNIRILGSPKVNSYDMDFGWGKVNKVEKLSSDATHGKVNVISLSGCKDFKGGIEIGMVLSRAKMNVFTSLFNGGLLELA
ncbi:anthocyanin 5-aromatic acyltransferase-like [Rutidosis leptorrhynchoides]|uniref:anthocyanin 5-aromatic acyltransferase-like n=1 Tax=Rutidosis leptorrhynchoides TaxID=125765 RepID=UPI003A9A019E